MLWEGDGGGTGVWSGQEVYYTSLAPESTAGTAGNWRGAQPSELSTELALPFTELAGVIGDIVFHPSEIISHEVMETVGDIIGGNGTNGGGGDHGNNFLKYLFGGLILLTTAPAIYRILTIDAKGKKAKDAEIVARELDHASDRTTQILTALAPVVALPVTYIAIDELENREIISGPLGDSVQTLIGTMAGGTLASGISSLLGKVI